MTNYYHQIIGCVDCGAERRRLDLHPGPRSGSKLKNVYERRTRCINCWQSIVHTRKKVVKK